MRMVIANSLEEDDLYVELYDGDELFAMISQKSSFVQVFSRDDGQPWSVSLAELLRDLQDARLRLSG